MKHIWLTNRQTDRHTLGKSQVFRAMVVPWFRFSLIEFKSVFLQYFVLWLLFPLLHDAGLSPSFSRIVIMWSPVKRTSLDYTNKNLFSVAFSSFLPWKAKIQPFSEQLKGIWNQDTFCLNECSYGFFDIYIEAFIYFDQRLSKVPFTHLSQSSCLAL